MLSTKRDLLARFYPPPADGFAGDLLAQPFTRYRLSTLLEMLQFYAEKFLEIGHRLTVIDRGASDAAVPMSQPHRDVLLNEANYLEAQCSEIGLVFTVLHIRKLRASLSTPHFTYQQVGNWVAQAFERMYDEMAGCLFLKVDVGKKVFYEAVTLFGHDMAQKFASAILDIEEAGKCLALERHTACVFHLMRVMEVGLRVLAAILNDPRLNPKRNPSWDSILKKCQEELAKPLGQRAPEWAKDDVFFSGAAATLMAVKDAWRNPTMHVETNYDEERARDVWNCVRAFMRHIATKLRE